MRVALFQATSRPRNEVNAHALGRAAMEARALGASVLVTPELFLSSYAPRDVAATDGWADRAELAAAARREGLWLVGSTVERIDDVAHITASLFDPHGHEVTRYRKRNLFGADERAMFLPGDERPEIVEIDGWAVALGICFDVEFPEFVRDVAVRGAELLLVPTAVPLREPTPSGPNPLDTRQVSLMVVPTRAFESQLFIAYANHGEPAFSGSSVLADPYGRRVVTAGPHEQLVVGDVTREVLDGARAAVDYLAIIERATLRDASRSPSA
ncbi:carbon-nitrogen hydrolase [Herbiconiux sp. SALV-R1]|nr:carbon-nitrogen hydrolase [Herbiconiux sp. SALV-R1]